MKSSAPNYSSKTVTTSDYTYWAFISYSHQDERWGRWLHKSLERYRIPNRLVGKTNAHGNEIPKRLFPIFRDKEELASSADLGKYINEALLKSRFLIVICSPHAANSKWVNAEIKYFKTLGRQDRVLALIVGGEPYASESEKPQMITRECFPSHLRHGIDPAGEVSKDRIEPLAADVRPGKDRPSEVLLRIVAGIIAVGYDDLRRRQSRRNRVRAVIAALAFVGLIFISAFIWMQFERFKRDRDALLPKPIPKEILDEQGLMDNFIQQLHRRPEELKISTSDYTQEITFSIMPLFDAGKAEMTENGKDVIGRLVYYIREQNFRFLREIQVYAHTDGVPIKTPESSSNWELSALRAARVVRFMEEQGIDPKVITLMPIAPGQYQPAVPEDSVMSRATNRRLRIRLIYAAHKY